MTVHRVCQRLKEALVSDLPTMVFVILASSMTLLGLLLLMASRALI